MHRFLPFGTISQSAQYGQGKSCVIYPRDPRHFMHIVISVDALIRQTNAQHQIECIVRGQPVAPCFRPDPGEVQGDMDVGSSGFISARHGGFTGPVTIKRHPEVHKPFTGLKEYDPRCTRPCPAFAANIPAEVRAVMR